MEDFLGHAVNEILRGQEIVRADDKTGIVEFPRGVFQELTGEEAPSLEHILAAEVDILGSYTPMSSPGRITLVIDTLRSLFWGSVDCLRNQYKLPVFKEDFRPMAHMVTLGTYHHEYFHFFSDIQRRLFPNFKFDHLKEEALAVAYSHLKITEERAKWNTQIGRLNRQVYQALLTEKFRYTSPGYRDWVKYPDGTTFGEGLADYINPPSYGFLRTSGVSVDALLMSQIEQVYGFRVRQDLA